MVIEVREAPVPVMLGWKFHYAPEDRVRITITWGKNYDEVFKSRKSVRDLLEKDRMYVLFSNGQTVIVRAKK